MISSNPITYDQIRISPFDLNAIYELHIEKTVNKHVRLLLKGQLKSGDQNQIDQYTSESRTVIKVDLVNTDGSTVKNLFTGIALSIMVRVTGDIHTVEAEGVSLTQLLDMEKRERSFQDTTMTFEDLTAAIAHIPDYDGKVTINIAKDIADKQIGSFILQYDETDWEFLTRVASRFGAVLVADAADENPRFWVGMPEGKKYRSLDLGSEACFKMGKYLGGWRKQASCDNDSIKERDFTYYEIDSLKELEIGDKVDFNNVDFTVGAVIAIMETGVLHLLYRFVRPGPLKQQQLYNQRLKGAGIAGMVLKVENDRVKLHLDIDAEQNESKACLFAMGCNYTTQGHTGWYCMPEERDNVILFFPGLKEEDAFIITSVRQDAIEQGTEPDIKCLRTKYDKELKCSPKELSFVGKNDAVFIRLHADNGIDIYSDSNVKINTDKSLEINATQDAGIIADQKLEFTCGASNITVADMLTINSNRINKKSG